MALVPSADTITVGGRVFNIPNSKLKTLVAFFSPSNYSTPMVPGFSTSGFSPAYQVPGGKTFKILAIRVFNASATAPAALGLGYGDTDVQQNNATPPTNLAYYQGAGGTQIPLGTASSAPLVEFDLGVGDSVPAGKYLCVYGDVNSGGVVYIYGTEE